MNKHINAEKVVHYIQKKQNKILILCRILNAQHVIFAIRDRKTKTNKTKTVQLDDAVKESKMMGVVIVTSNADRNQSNRTNKSC